MCAMNHVKIILFSVTNKKKKALNLKMSSNNV